MFNIALENVVREANPDIRGTKLHKSLQILAYTDDAVIVRRYENAVKDVFNRLEMEAQEVGLMINYNKTKYMKSGKLILIITTLHRKYTTELIWQINATVDSEI
jgi:ribosomal protein L22